MFLHKNKPIVAGLACAAAAMIIGLAANPAQAQSRKARYHASYSGEQDSGERDTCNHRQVGIIQKTRDGVNYFYGGSDTPSPRTSYSYLYLRNGNFGQPYDAPYPVMPYISMEP